MGKVMDKDTKGLGRGRQRHGKERGDGTMERPRMDDPRHGYDERAAGCHVCGCCLAAARL